MSRIEKKSIEKSDVENALIELASFRFEDEDNITEDHIKALNIIISIANKYLEGELIDKGDSNESFRSRNK